MCPELSSWLVPGTGPWGRVPVGAGWAGQHPPLPHATPPAEEGSLCQLWGLRNCSLVGPDRCPGFWLAGGGGSGPGVCSLPVFPPDPGDVGGQGLWLRVGPSARCVAGGGRGAAAQVWLAGKPNPCPPPPPGPGSGSPRPHATSECHRQQSLQGWSSAWSGSQGSLPGPVVSSGSSGCPGSQPRGICLWREGRVR